MCGRYAFNSDADFVAKLFGLAEIPEFLTPRFNIAPTQKVPVVAAKPDGLTLPLIPLLPDYPASATSRWKNDSIASARSGWRAAKSLGRGTIPAAEARGYSDATTSSTVAPSAPGQRNEGEASR